MSKTLTIEIPDEVFSGVKEVAESKGKTTEKIVLEVVLKTFKTKSGNLSPAEKDRALKELMDFSGAVDSGNRRSADNDQIDVDLANEAGKNL